ncbi:hypothetical protein N7494_006021 [Penicillium frequentans]|uniref:Uncharacterized protein n=1 Tax=Penicillium frequentans TaxID=3151616 RepID=A0AAD6GG88_9EURO|nr:hypothetical protein N7494_006021 [Penicillium glabrum]
MGLGKGENKSEVKSKNEVGTCKRWKQVKSKKEVGLGEVRTSPKLKARMKLELGGDGSKFKKRRNEVGTCKR